MKRIRLAKIAIAITTFACTALLSFGWSEQRGVSLCRSRVRGRGWVARCSARSSWETLLSLTEFLTNVCRTFCEA